ncbi:MAG TPA: hypothetical protein PLA68_14845 [Panacibacter sp.]|nr:hypothetical protein [Panacibacter sp.]
MSDEIDLLPEENAEELYERKSFVIDKGQEPLRIDKWVQQHLTNTTRSKIQQGIDAGFITLNGAP